MISDHPVLHAASHRLAPYLALALLAGPMFFFRLGQYGLVNQDEVIFQQIAARMATTGNWLDYEIPGRTLTTGGMMTAPLLFHAKACLIRLFGDNRWTMRMPSALFALIAVLLTCRFAIRLGGRRVGFLAGLILLTTWQFVFWHSGRTGELEPLIVCLTILAADSFLRAMETGDGFLRHHICLILLAQLKLPFLIIPTLAELLFFATTRRAQERMREWAVLGLVLFPLAALWPLFLMITRMHVFCQGARFMLEQTTSPEWVESRRYAHPLGNAWYYGRIVLFGAFPYALAYPPAVLLAMKRCRTAATGLRQRLGLALVAAVLVFFVVVARKCPWYIMPIYPFLSVFVALWLDRLRQEPQNLAARLGMASVLSLMALVHVDIMQPNPFAQVAFTIPVTIAVRAPFALSPWHALLLVGPTLAAGLYLGVRMVERRWAKATPIILMLLLLGLGTVRCGLTLRHTNYVSELEHAARTITAAKRAGEPIPDNLDLHVTDAAAGPMLMWYFGADYAIVSWNMDKHPNIVHLARKEP